MDWLLTAPFSGFSSRVVGNIGMNHNIQYSLFFTFIIITVVGCLRVEDQLECKFQVF
jgi:hypothetical protein